MWVWVWVWVWGGAGVACACGPRVLCVYVFVCVYVCAWGGGGVHLCTYVGGGGACTSMCVGGIFHLLCNDLVHLLKPLLSRQPTPPLLCLYAANLTQFIQQVHHQM